MRGVQLPTANGRERGVEDGIEGRRAVLDGVSINVNLEGAAHLANGLGGAIVFGILEAVAADHGLEFAGRVVDGDESRLRGGLLFELDAGSGFAQFENLELSEVADFEQFRRFSAAGPGELGRRQEGAVRANLDER